MSDEVCLEQKCSSTFSACHAGPCWRCLTWLHGSCADTAPVLKQRPPPLQILRSQECLDAAHLEPRHETVAVGVEFREYILSADGCAVRSATGIRATLEHAASAEQQPRGRLTLVWYLPSRVIRVSNLAVNCFSSKPPGRSRLFCPAMLCSSSKLRAPFYTVSGHPQCACACEHWKPCSKRIAKADAPRLRRTALAAPSPQPPFRRNSAVRPPSAQARTPVRGIASQRHKGATPVA